MPCGVIGNTSDFGSDILGFSYSETRCEQVLARQLGILSVPQIATITDTGVKHGMNKSTSEILLVLVGESR
jgi:hypothetical protein